MLTVCRRYRYRIGTVCQTSKLLRERVAGGSSWQTVADSQPPNTQLGVVGVPQGVTDVVGELVGLGVG